MEVYEPTPKWGSETFELILERMNDRSNRDQREGGVIWDANASSAVELQEIYIALDDILKEAFGDSASREFLVRITKARNITPFSATNAILRGVFEPANIDLTGRRFSMPNTPLTYTVENRTDLGWELRCEELGKVGNGFFGSITPLWGGDPRLTRAEITELLIPAQDEEPTESLRERYFNSFDEKGFGGNMRDYYVNTTSIDGVGAVRITPVWDGGGTVLLTVLDYLYNSATPELINRVQYNIDPFRDGKGIGIAPIGHVVTVRTTDEVIVNISTEITYRSGYTWEIVQNEILETIENYLLELRKSWEDQDEITPLGFFENPLYVVISQINSRILNINGIVDIQNTRINGESVNLVIDKYYIPVLGAVTV